MSLIALLSLCVLFVGCSAAVDVGQMDSYEVREHSLNRPYPAGKLFSSRSATSRHNFRFPLVFSTANSYWQLVGNTIVTDRYIRLTSDSQSKAGGLWSAVPVTYPDWETHIHFKVHGTGKELFGDGFAIWYARDPKIIGKVRSPPFSSIAHFPPRLDSGPVFGYTDFFHGLAIFMDTYSNHNGPHNVSPPFE